jgi:hypothetical protein
LARGWAAASHKTNVAVTNVAVTNVAVTYVAVTWMVSAPTD